MNGGKQNNNKKLPNPLATPELPSGEPRGSAVNWKAWGLFAAVVAIVGVTVWALLATRIFVPREILAKTFLATRDLAQPDTVVQTAWAAIAAVMVFVVQLSVGFLRNSSRAIHKR